MFVTTKTLLGGIIFDRCIVFALPANLLLNFLTKWQITICIRHFPMLRSLALQAAGDLKPIFQRLVKSMVRIKKNAAQKDGIAIRK